MSSQERILRQINERIRQNMQNDHLSYLQLDSICIRHITKQIKHILQSHPHIEYLTMNDCHLQSLANFPKLDNLAMLQLSNNQIQDDSLFHLLKCSHISHLMIDQNKLKNIEKVSVLRQLGNLEQLEIAGNAIGESEFYREELFDRIPQLKIIDCHDRKGNVAINSQSQDDQQGDNSLIHNKDTQKLSSSIKMQSKSLLNLLQNQSQQEKEINYQMSFGKLQQEQEKQQIDFMTLRQINQITGTKKFKLQQNTHMNNQKLLFNKKTVAESGDSSSPEQQQYCHYRCQDYQE